ncbi:hypothetical protein F2P81_024072 [Scophthalmus maximus]|uniref:Borealin N-terminal domain-containing protein n=2 Tax=Scophthalmus maximus TaxID=52904 RepID=A0A6A4RWG2_SCOMX|nr:hypothetical protein F2P81_024072 [Scophthalmus maximus]
MSLRRKRNASNAQSKEQQGRDMCQRRLALFVRQFEKEAEERMNELDARMENMLATVDKVYNVEVMKMPLSLRNTLLADLMSVKSTDSPPVQSAAVPRASVKLGNKTKRTRTLAGSNSTGNLRGSTVTAKRNQSRLTKSNEQTAPVKPKLRSVVSTGDLHCSVAGSAAHITVTTAQGQTVSFSEETKYEINLDMLDDVAWCQIQRLTQNPVFRKTGPNPTLCSAPSHTLLMYWCYENENVTLWPRLEPNADDLYIFTGHSAVVFRCVKETDLIIIHSNKLHLTGNLANCIRMWARMKAIGKRQGDNALNVTGPILQFYERYYNATYPLSKSEEIAVSDAEAKDSGSEPDSDEAGCGTSKPVDDADSTFTAAEMVSAVSSTVIETPPPSEVVLTLIKNDLYGANKDKDNCFSPKLQGVT